MPLQHRWCNGYDVVGNFALRGREYRVCDADGKTVHVIDGVRSAIDYAASLPAGEVAEPEPVEVKPEKIPIGKPEVGVISDEVVEQPKFTLPDAEVHSIPDTTKPWERPEMYPPNKPKEDD